jgi:hypothetical protein
MHKPLLEPIALVSDAAGAIKNAFKNVFSNQNELVTCWAHIKRKIDSKVSMISDKSIQEEIVSDIELLQLCESCELFDKAIKLFERKWKTQRQTNSHLNDFLKYFADEWLVETNRGWYEGVALFVPSTNNALEATNRTIKDDSTFRERFSLSRFLSLATTIVYNWSYERDPTNINVKLFASEPTISLNLWTKSYEWAKSSKDIIGEEECSRRVYYIPAAASEKINENDLVKYKKQCFTTFQQFKKSFSIWRLEDGSNWNNAKCNCPAFLKNYICKHVVGLGIRLKQCRPPAAAKHVPIGQKRKRGRPAKAKKALLVQ